jgi:hypothetical protein
MKYEVSLMGKICYYTGAITLYHYGTKGNGNVGFVNGLFKKWHPLTWLILVLATVPCALVGEKLTDVVPMKLGDYYKENFKKVTRKDFL